MSRYFQWALRSHTSYTLIALCKSNLNRFCCNATVICIHCHLTPTHPLTRNSGDNDLPSITALLYTPHCGDNWILNTQLLFPHLSRTMKNKNWVNIKYKIEVPIFLARNQNPSTFSALQGHSSSHYPGHSLPQGGREEGEVGVSGFRLLVPNICKQW